MSRLRSGEAAGRVRGRLVACRRVEVVVSRVREGAAEGAAPEGRGGGAQYRHDGATMGLSAPVAQRTRAFGYEPKGREFDSLRGY